MKHITLFLLSIFCFQFAHAQRKHQVGLGFDYGMYLSVPKAWRGNVNPFFYNENDGFNNGNRYYPSIHYIYDKKWQITAMYQYYSQIAGNKKLDNLQPEFEPFFYQRVMYNFDLLVGRELLSLLPKMNNSGRKSTLFFHVGLRYVLPDSYYSKAEPFYFPPRHRYMISGLYSPNNPKQQPFKLALHLEYRYNIAQNLGVNVNLNYSYVYKLGSPVIGQVGLRYTF